MESFGTDESAVLAVPIGLNPSDLLIHIFLFCDDPISIVRFGRVCCRWAEVVRLDRLWAVLSTRMGWPEKPREDFMLKYLACLRLREGIPKVRKFSAAKYSGVQALYVPEPVRVFSWGVKSRFLSFNSETVIVALTAPTYGVFVLNLKDDKYDKLNFLCGAAYTAVAFGDGVMVYAETDSSLTIADLHTSQLHLLPLGHTSTVTRVCVDKSSKFALTASYDQTVMLWNLELRSQVCVFEGHTGTIWAIDFHPKDPSIIATGSNDHTVRIWTARPSPALLCPPLEGHARSLMCVRFDPFHPDRFVYSGSYDLTVRMWDISCGGDPDMARCLRIFEGHTSTIFDIQVTPYFMVSAGRDTKLIIFDRESGAVVAKFAGHDETIKCMVMKAANVGLNAVLSLLTASYDGTIRVWDLGIPNVEEEV
eukprot:186964_1